METRRYETLDALRGVAAVAVMVFHLKSIRLEPELVPHGYLAVDFFFVLSGFVVAYAYEAALLSSLSLRAFVVKRLIRLHPLALLGAAMGLLLLLLKWRFYPDKVDPLPRILVAGMFNSLMLPTPFGGATSHHETFPTNGPLWTLFFEFVANVLWAWIGIRLRTVGLLTVVLGSWVTMAVYAYHAHTLNVGFDIATFPAGLARVCFGFPLGVVIFRLRSSLRLPALPGGALLLGAILLMILASPVNEDETGVPWWDLSSVLVWLPLIVVFGMAQGASGRVGALLGALSYPIYVLHFPMLLVASGLYQTVLRSWSVHLVVVVTLVMIVGVAFAALRLYDEPVRRVLSRAARRHDLFRPRTGSMRPAAIGPDA